MNRATLWIVLLAVCALGVAGCSSGHLQVLMTTAPTTLAAGATTNVVATVKHDHRGAGVSWTCTPVGACGSFNPAQTASGVASAYTAPIVAPAGGSVTITATSVANPARSASAIIAITSNNFVFYVSGEEGANVGGGAGDDTFAVYSIAGVVAMSSDNSTVLGGEQDFNDGVLFTSPQPTGDTITGGTLVMAADGSGNGVLTITTDNPNLPNGGTEVFAVNFANPKHAVIIEFDGSTAFGSFDLQSSVAAPVSASFSFTASGTNTSLDPVVEAGVFTLDASSTLTGTVDINDADAGLSIGNAIPAGVSLGAPDLFGRGAVAGSIDGTTIINYYIVGPEVIRFVDVDLTDQSVGSAYGQGSTAGSFSSASIGQSVFSIGNSADLYGAVGQFTTSTIVGGAAPRTRTPIGQGVPAACTGTGLCDFSGVGDLNDLFHGTQLLAQPIDGTYSIAANGYGSLTFTTTLGDIDTLGVYAVDPTLNILDPNNTTDGLGGALIAEMDVNLIGTGSIVPQTDVTVASFNGLYSIGGQGDTTTDADEFDFVGGATATTGTTVAFSGTGALSDPFGALTGTVVESSNATFNSTFTPDAVNAGRYTGVLEVAASDESFGTVDLAVTAYQAYAGQLFWVETDPGGYFLGPLELGTASSAAAKRANAKASIKKH